MNAFPKGLSSAGLLLFSLLIWLLFTAILLSNRRSKLNQWSFFTGMLFSTGVWKEYFYYGLVPVLRDHFPGIQERLYMEIYSVLTAILFYWCMPCVMILVFYYCTLSEVCPKFFSTVRYFVFLPAVVWGIFIPYSQTRYYQMYVPMYYPLITLYNWAYGLVITVLILVTLYKKRLASSFQQKKFIAVTILLPMWYWLITALLIHALRLWQFRKAWQGNLLVIIFLLFYYVFHLFRDGIWGCRLYRMMYDPMKDPVQIHKSTEFINHTLKNELVKIDWCIHSLRQNLPEAPTELTIIENSTRHLQEFLKRSSFLSGNIYLQYKTFSIYPVLLQCVHDMRSEYDHQNIRWSLDCEKTALIHTDPEHLREVFNNLLRNAAEAVGREGTIRITYSTDTKKRCCRLTVTDDGCGISKEAIPQLFHPYYTTKTSAIQHMGLGLYYCLQVMEKQNGGIHVKSIPGKGTTFFLTFPLQKKYYEVDYEKNNDKNTDRGR